MKNKAKFALTVHQPWAWLIVNGYKDIENRSWKFDDKFSGKQIFIHAGKRLMSKQDYKEFKSLCIKNKIKKYPKSPEEFDYGAIIGTVTLNGCDEESASNWASPGDFHWQLKNAMQIKATALRGQHGLFEVKL